MGLKAGRRDVHPLTYAEHPFLRCCLDCLDLFDYLGPYLLEDSVAADTLHFWQSGELLLSRLGSAPHAFVDRAGEHLYRLLFLSHWVRREFLSYKGVVELHSAALYLMARIAVRNRRMSAVLNLVLPAFRAVNMKGISTTLLPSGLSTSSVSSW